MAKKTGNDKGPDSRHGNCQDFQVLESIRSCSDGKLDILVAQLHQYAKEQSPQDRSEVHGEEY